MQCPAWHDRFERFLRDQPDEEHHADVVDDESQGMSEAEVAQPGRVSPHESHHHSDRQQKKAVDQNGDGRANGAPMRGDVHNSWRYGMRCHRPPPGEVWPRLRITPASTVLPERDTVWKNRSAPTTSTAVNVCSRSNAAAVAALRRSVRTFCPPAPVTKYEIPC